MIRVVRPPQEPPTLAAARAEQLPKLRALVAAQTGPGPRPPEKTLFTSYDVAKEALRVIVGNKCWCCERPLGKYDPIEHYRPKQRASRGPSMLRDGYWWLAWTWANLMLLCTECNNVKGTQFPLRHGCTPLAPEEEPPGNEVALLIDPCAVNPFHHLRFEQDRSGRWRARPVPGSEIGEKTIEVLGLDGMKKRPGIVDQYHVHVALAVEPRVDLLKAAIRLGDAKEVFCVWDKTCRALLRKNSPYAALSYHALDRRVPPPVRRRWMVTLPEPPWDPLTDPAACGPTP
ncbi:MAG: hypothetical protein U0324_30555 [Polyangiales bacterium]